MAWLKEIIYHDVDGKRRTKSFKIKAHKNGSGFHVDKDSEAASLIFAKTDECHDFKGRRFYEQ